MDETVKNLPANAGDVGSILGWEDPLEKEMAKHSSILAWRIHGQRSLVGYSPWGPEKSAVTELGQKHVLYGVREGGPHNITEPFPDTQGIKRLRSQLGSRVNNLGHCFFSPLYQ